MVHAKKISVVKSQRRRALCSPRARINILKLQKKVDPAILFAFKLPSLGAIEQLVEAQLLHPAETLFNEKYGCLGEEDHRKIIDEFRKSELCSLTREFAIKWWDTFVNENRDRPKLVVRLIVELEERKCSVSDFFDAYLYANIDIIQASLYLLDFARSEKGKIEEEKLSKLEFNVHARFVSELEECFELDRRMDPQCAAWFRKFSADAKRWSREDIMSILYLVSRRLTLHQLVYLSSLAQSVKPLSLLYFYRALLLNQESVWGKLYNQAGEGALNKFARDDVTELRYYNLFCLIQGHFLKSLGIQAKIKKSSFDLIEPALKDTPTKLKERLSLELIKSFSYADSDAKKSVARTGEAFKWTLCEEEIIEILSAANSELRLEAGNSE